MTHHATTGEARDEAVAGRTGDEADNPHASTAPSSPEGNAGSLSERIATPYVLYDVSRLLKQGDQNSPTGIDRLDLHFALELLRSRRRNFLPVVRFMKRAVLLPTGEIRKFLESLSRTWNGEEQNAPDAQPPGKLRIALQHQLSGRGLRRLKEAAENGEVTYVCCSHSGLPMEKGLLPTLRRRFNVLPLIYVHDIIPFDFPEYMMPQTGRRLRRFFENIIPAQPRLMANSRYTAQRLRAWMEKEFSCKLDDAPEVLVPQPSWLNIPKEVKPSTSIADLIHDHPCYFLVLGTIEPRKNHLLLLNIWRKWAHAGTRPLPHLFVVGRRGWENENIVDMLERCEAIRPWVHELGPLPQADVVALMKNARALLMPTFAEGLGLPALEARSMNVPIIASDIPVFREVLAGDRRATLLDPIDGPSWERAILDMARA